MTYTLLGASTLGFDLVRTTAGAQTAGLLLTTLSLRPADLAQLAGGHPGPSRRGLVIRALETSETAGRATQTRLRTTSALAPGEAARIMLQELQVTRLGTAQALDRLVRREILDWTWTPAAAAGGPPAQSYLGSMASDVLADAVIASYASDHLEAELVQALSSALSRTRFPLQVEPGPDVPQDTVALLDRLTRANEEDRRQLLAAVEVARRHTAQWAPAMHEATWAAHLGGRVRTAAAAQLLAVRAFQAAGFSTQDAAQGAWNLVSGAVAASVVADLLSDEHHAQLTSPWEAAFGSSDG